MMGDEIHLSQRYAHIDHSRDYPDREADDVIADLIEYIAKNEGATGAKARSMVDFGMHKRLIADRTYESVLYRELMEVMLGVNAHCATDVPALNTLPFGMRITPLQSGGFHVLFSPYMRAEDDSWSQLRRRDTLGAIGNRRAVHQIETIGISQRTIDRINHFMAYGYSEQDNKKFVSEIKRRDTEFARAYLVREAKYRRFGDKYIEFIERWANDALTRAREKT